MKNSSVQPYLIGVAGGSGSGKTTVVETLMKLLGSKQVVRIAHDSYYRNQSHMEMEERVKTNYDHPLALETELLVEHVQKLLAGESVEIPEYDFVNHTRGSKVHTISPCKVLIIEGILLFESTALRKLFDLKIYVDTDPDLRLARRLQRDVAERGRTFEYSLEQYLKFTRPMHLEFVEPSKRYADIILPEGVNEPAIDVLVAKVLKEAGK